MNEESFEYKLMQQLGKEEITQEPIINLDEEAMKTKTNRWLYGKPNKQQLKAIKKVNELSKTLKNHRHDD